MRIYILFFCLCALPAAAVTFYVDDNRPDDSGDGLTWTTAKKTIQAAVDIATTNARVIMVTNGHYVITNQISAFISGPGGGHMKIQSVNGPGVTIIDGQQTSSLFYNGIIAGFTLRNGFTEGYGGAAVFATISNCIVELNRAEMDGGGLYYCRVYDSIIRNNSAVYSGGGMSGCYAYNCLIVSNTAGSAGGAGYAYEDARFIGGAFNCTFVFNTATSGWATGGADLFGCPVENSIFFYNRSAYETDYYVPNVITGAPSFVNMHAGDFRLLPHSPCVDAGIVSTNLLSHDLAGSPRALDGDNNGDARPDFGAYEYAHPRADTDGDGLADAWEVEHGLNAVDAADAGEDPDLDTVNNRGEFLADTDPHDPGDYLAITAMDPQDPSVLDYPASPHRAYTLMRREGEAPWAPVPGRIGLPGLVSKNPYRYSPEPSPLSAWHAVAASIPATLQDGLDNDQIIFSTDDDFPWYTQGEVTHDGEDAVFGGIYDPIGGGGMTASVQGPGVLSFWQKMSISAYSWFEFWIGSNLKIQFRGDMDWNQVVFNVPPGVHQLRWNYYYNSFAPSFDDANLVWFDQLTWTRTALDEGDDHAGHYNPGPIPVSANGGAGFNPWLNEAATERFITQSSTNGSGDIDSENGLSFRFYDEGGAMVNEKRFFNGALFPGEVFRVKLAYNWNGGARGINILSPSHEPLCNINFGGDDTLSFKWGWQDPMDISTHWSPTTTLDVAVTQLPHNQLHVHVARNDGREWNFYSESLSGPADGIAFYNTGHPGGDVRYALYANHLYIERQPPP